jgi:hypothetical protein
MDELGDQSNMYLNTIGNYLMCTQLPGDKTRYKDDFQNHLSVILQGANRLGGAPASVLSGQYGLVLDDLPASPLLFTRGKQETSKQQLIKYGVFDRRKISVKKKLLDDWVY